MNTDENQPKCASTPIL